MWSLADFQQWGRSWWGMHFSVTLFRSINTIQRLFGSLHSLTVSYSQTGTRTLFWNIVLAGTVGSDVRLKQSAENPARSLALTPPLNLMHIVGERETFVVGYLHGHQHRALSGSDCVQGPYLDPLVYMPQEDTTAAPKPGVWSPWLRMWNYLHCQIPSQLSGTTGASPGTIAAQRDGLWRATIPHFP